MEIWICRTAHQGEQSPTSAPNFADSLVIGDETSTYLTDYIDNRSKRFAPQYESVPWKLHPVRASKNCYCVDSV